MPSMAANATYGVLGLVCACVLLSLAAPSTIWQQAVRKMSRVDGIVPQKSRMKIVVQCWPYRCR